MNFDVETTKDKLGNRLQTEIETWKEWDNLCSEFTQRRFLKTLPREIIPRQHFGYAMRCPLARNRK